MAPSKKWPPYTDEDIELLKSLFYDYVDLHEIAQRLGRTYGSVRLRCTILRLRRSNIVSRCLQWTPSHLQREQVIEMGEREFIRAAYAWRREQGERVLAEIKGAEYERKAQLIAITDEILCRKDLSRRQKMTALREAGMTQQAIGDIFKVTRERIRQLTCPIWQAKYRALHPKSKVGRSRNEG